MVHAAGFAAVLCFGVCQQWFGGTALGACMRVHAWYWQQNCMNFLLLGLCQQSFESRSALIGLYWGADITSLPRAESIPCMLAVGGARGPSSQLG
jgi:hypothetical protein